MQQGTRGYDSLKATPFTSSSSCISPPPATSHELIVGHALPRRPTSGGLASTPTPLSSSSGGYVNSTPAHNCLLHTALSASPGRRILVLSPATFYYILASSVICQVCTSPLILSASQSLTFMQIWYLTPRARHFNT